MSHLRCISARQRFSPNYFQPGIISPTLKLFFAPFVVFAFFTINSCLSNYPYDPARITSTEWSARIYDVGHTTLHPGQINLARV